MAVHADLAIAVEIVEQHELPGELVVIGGDFLAEDGEARVAVALTEISQHLVVRAIFLDDVEHVLDGRPNADVAGNNSGRRRSLGGYELIVVIRRIVIYLFGPPALVRL